VSEIGVNLKFVGWQLYTNSVALRVALMFERESVTMTEYANVPEVALVLTTPLAVVLVCCKVKKLGRPVPVS